MTFVPGDVVSQVSHLTPAACPYCSACPSIPCTLHAGVTLQEDLERLDQAKHAFVYELAKALGIVRLCDWAARRLS